jgi:5-methylcytosine-specific restriction endonuclease McrA
MNNDQSNTFSLSQTLYKKLSNEELLQKAQATVKNERTIQAEVIRILIEVERRRLHASLGYRSLFEFCVKELRYSESAAWRRIASMQVIKDLPGTEEKLISGELSLKTLTSVQTFINNEEKTSKQPFTIEQKKQILQSVENKTGRETEAILASLSPVPAPPFERERHLNGTDVEIRFVADFPLLGRLHRLKDLNSHRDPSRSYRGLFEWLSDLGLKTSDPLTKEVKRVSDSTEPKSDRYIPNDLKIRVWKRDQGKCTYKDPKSGRQCSSTSFIEIDHITPLALGGETAFENLRLYCRTHNLEAARQAYGHGKIQSEIRSTRRQSQAVKT